MNDGEPSWLQWLLGPVFIIIAPFALHELMRVPTDASAVVLVLLAVAYLLGISRGRA